MDFGTPALEVVDGAALKGIQRVAVTSFTVQYVLEQVWDTSYTSGGTVRTVTDNGAGKLSGAATGVIDYASRAILLRPQFMPDPGAQLSINCQLDALVTENLTGGSPDGGGFLALTLAQQPAAGTLQVQWATVRDVSNTAGATLSTTTASKGPDTTSTVIQYPDWWSPPATEGMGINWPRAD